MYRIDTSNFSRRMLRGLLDMLDERMASEDVQPGPYINLLDKEDYDVATAWLEGWRARQEWLLVDERERELHDAEWRGHLAKED